MKEIRVSRKALCVVLIICMTFFAGISTFAENNGITASSEKPEERVCADNNKHYLEEAVIKLMQEGKLSREKAEKILEYKKKKVDEFSKLTKVEKKQMKGQYKKGSLLRDLSQDGIITEAEAQAIKAKLYEMKEARLADGMQELVDKEVLTQKDIENIRSYMLKVREERKAQIDKLKTMTPEQRKEYFNNAKRDKKDILARMVADKVITQEQAEAIRKAIPELDKSRYRNSK